MDQENKPKRLVFVKTNERHQLYLAGADGQPLKLPGKEFAFIKIDNTREPTPEEVAYIQEHITALFLECTMYSSSLPMPSKN